MMCARRSCFWATLGALLLVSAAGCGDAPAPAPQPITAPLSTQPEEELEVPEQTEPPVEPESPAAGTLNESGSDATPDDKTKLPVDPSQTENPPPPGTTGGQEPPPKSTATSPAATPAGLTTAVAGTSDSPTTAGTSATSLLPGGIRLLVPDKTFKVEGPGGAVRVSYDDLDLQKVLNMDPVPVDCVKHFPAWLRQLDGKQVRIRGYMKPGFLTEGIEQFLQVRDTGLCCFGPKGRIHDMIEVRLKTGTTTDYLHLVPFDVVGRFRIEPVELDDDGTLYGLYFLDDAEILKK